MNDIKEIKNQLHATFKIKDLGQLKYFIGLEISRTHEGIHVCQRKYALNILANTGMLNAKPPNTPMAKRNENLFDQTLSIYDASNY